MSSPASVSGDERLRLFLALRPPDDVLDEIEGWQHAQLPSVRTVPREHLHVTLAFLGHRPAGDLEAIVRALRGAAAAASREIRLTPLRYRETRSVGMLVLDDEEERAALFAGDVQERLV
jgi:2'-5' RNA ligase